MQVRESTRRVGAPNERPGILSARLAYEARGLTLLLLFGGLVAPGCAGRPLGGGRSLASMSLPTLQGEMRSFGRSPEDPLLVNFFATWCAPCLMEVPVLNALQARPGLQVVAVSLDLYPHKVLPLFAQAVGSHYPILIASEEIRSAQSAFAYLPEIPVSFLLNQNRQIVATFPGPLSVQRVDKVLRALGMQSGEQARPPSRPSSKDHGTDTR